MFRVTVDEIRAPTPEDPRSEREIYAQSVDAPLDDKRMKRIIDAVNYSPRVRNRGKKEPAADLL